MKTNLEIVQQGYAEFSKGNIAGILEILSEDIIWEFPSSALVSFSGVFKGRQGVLDFFQHVAASNNFTEFAVDTFIADGDHVVALGHLSGVAKPTGKPSNNKWAHFWQLKEGKVIKHYEYVDTAEIRDAFSN